MRNVHCIIAQTEGEVMDAQRVRGQVYGTEEGMLPASVCIEGREIDAQDDCAGTMHFVAYAGHEPVGTVRLLRAGTGATSGASGRLGLDLESKFELGGGFSTPGIVPAEVTRFCVVRKYRGTRVTEALLWALHAESTRLGITHWVAGANTQTDFVEDAVLAYRVAHEKKLLSERFRAEPRIRERPQTPRRRPWYTGEQRRRARQGELSGLDLPRPLSLFATRMCARYIGLPVYDTYFNVFALPLVASLAELAAQWAGCPGQNIHPIVPSNASTSWVVAAR